MDSFAISPDARGPDRLATKPSSVLGTIRIHPRQIRSERELR